MKKGSAKSWNMSLRAIVELRGAKDPSPNILERLGWGDYRKRVALNWGKRVAVFTSYASARAYLEWALLDEPDERGCRYRKESLLSGCDRAWVTSMWVDVPVDPEIK